MNRSEHEGCLRRVRRGLEPLRPSRNPILAGGLRRSRHALARSPWVGLLVLLLIGQVVLSVLCTVQPKDPAPLFNVSPLGYFYYYIQFSVFHLALYLCPLLWFLPAWVARGRRGDWEQLVLTASSRAEIFWGFVLPKAGFVFLAVYAFYMTMWPWDNWWLLWFTGHDMTPQHPWTRLHVVITTLYFLTVLTFNSTLAVWLGLRGRSAVLAGLWLFLLTALLDFGTYGLVFSVDKLSPPRSSYDPEVFSWPGILWTMLVAHSNRVFAAIYYPAKWVLIVWIIRDITHPAGAWRWVERESRK